MKLFSQYSNPCDHDTQRYRRTGGRLAVAIGYRVLRSRSLNRYRQTMTDKMLITV